MIKNRVFQEKTFFRVLVVALSIALFSGVLDQRNHATACCVENAALNIRTQYSPIPGGAHVDQSAGWGHVMDLDISFRDTTGEACELEWLEWTDYVVPGMRGNGIVPNVWIDHFKHVTESSTFRPWFSAMKRIQSLTDQKVAARISDYPALSLTSSRNDAATGRRLFDSAARRLLIKARVKSGGDQCQLKEKAFFADQNLSVDSGNPGYGRLTVSKAYEVRASSSGIDEKTFHDVLERIETLYAPVFEKRGLEFQARALWDLNEVNSSADLEDNIAFVSMYGGLARHPLMTERAFAMLVCHEIGHHLSPGDKKLRLMDEGLRPYWAATEGDADYFAAQDCLPNYYLQHLESLQSDEAVVKEAQNTHVMDSVECPWGDTSEDQLICKTVARASFEFANILRMLERVPTNIVPLVHPLTPDTRVTPFLYQEHPNAQCRLDTFIAAIKDQPRPSCWYSETKLSDFDLVFD